MRPDWAAESGDWLARAERDLLMAERALSIEPRLLDAAAYHSQQGAEKALKGFLSAHGRPFPKSHDLGPLVAQCEAIEASFAEWGGIAIILTPYAVAFRYPGGPLEPALEEAEEALELARALVAHVQGLVARGG